jgi:hypothetical protein
MGEGLGDARHAVRTKSARIFTSRIPDLDLPAALALRILLRPALT